MRFRYIKKKIKNCFKKDCPIRLLPIFSNIFERVIYNSLINHFQSNKVTFYFFKIFYYFFYLMIHTLPNYSQLYMKYKQHLIRIQLLMWEVVYFLASQKPLIMSGIVVFYSSYRLMELKVNFLFYLKIILIIVNKE